MENLSELKIVLITSLYGYSDMVKRYGGVTSNDGLKFPLKKISMDTLALAINNATSSECPNKGELLERLELEKERRLKRIDTSNGLEEFYLLFGCCEKFIQRFESLNLSKKESKRFTKMNIKEKGDFIKNAILKATHPNYIINVPINKEDYFEYTKNHKFLYLKSVLIASKYGTELPNKEKFLSALNQVTNSTLALAINNAKNNKISRKNLMLNLLEEEKESRAKKIRIGSWESLEEFYLILGDSNIFRNKLGRFALREKVGNSESQHLKEGLKRFSEKLERLSNSKQESFIKDTIFNIRKRREDVDYEDSGEYFLDGP